MNSRSLQEQPALSEPPLQPDNCLLNLDYSLSGGCLMKKKDTPLPSWSWVIQLGVSLTQLDRPSPSGEAAFSRYFRNRIPALKCEVQRYGLLVIVHSYPLGVSSISFCNKLYPCSYCTLFSDRDHKDLGEKDSRARSWWWTPEVHNRAWSICWLIARWKAQPE